jgi:hypothetical protein
MQVEKRFLAEIKVLDLTIEKVQLIKLFACRCWWLVCRQLVLEFIEDLRSFLENETISLLFDLLLKRQMAFGFDHLW